MAHLQMTSKITYIWLLCDSTLSFSCFHCIVLWLDLIILILLQCTLLKLFLWDSQKNKHYFFTLTSFFVWDERLSKFHIQGTLRYPGASVSGRFFLGTYFLSLFCLIYPEFRVPDPDGLFLTFPYEWKILV